MGKLRIRNKNKLSLKIKIDNKKWLGIVRLPNPFVKMLNNAEFLRQRFLSLIEAISADEFSNDACRRDLVVYVCFENVVKHLNHSTHLVVALI